WGITSRSCCFPAIVTCSIYCSSRLGRKEPRGPQTLPPLLRSAARQHLKRTKAAGINEEAHSLRHACFGGGRLALDRAQADQARAARGGAAFRPGGGHSGARSLGWSSLGTGTRRPRFSPSSPHRCRLR